MTTDSGKRRLLKALGAGAVGATAVKTGVIPGSWVKPVLDSVVMSAEAQPPLPTPSPSPAPMMTDPVSVPVSPSTTGFVALVAGMLGYIGFKNLSGRKAEKQEVRTPRSRD